jgi:hypothetical protein
VTDPVRVHELLETPLKPPVPVHAWLVSSPVPVFNPRGLIVRAKRPRGCVS